MLGSKTMIGLGVGTAGIGVGASYIGNRNYEQEKMRTRHGSTRGASNRNMVMARFADNQGMDSDGLATGITYGAVLGGAGVYGGRSLLQRNAPNFLEGMNRVGRGKSGIIMGILGGAVVGGGVQAGMNYMDNNASLGQTQHKFTGDDQDAQGNLAVSSSNRWMNVGGGLIGGGVAAAGMTIANKMAGETDSFSGKAFKMGTGRVAAGVVGVGVAYMLSRSGDNASSSSSRIRGLGY